MNNRISGLLGIASLLIIAPWLQGCFSSSKAAAQNNDQERRFSVAVSTIEEHAFRESVNVQGTLVPKNYAMVAPRVDGVLTAMFVEDGEAVEANKTALFQIDKEILTQAYEISQQDTAVAQCARVDGEAQKEAAQAQFDKMKLDYERFTRLMEDKAITLDAMEQVEAGYKVAQAQLKRATTAVRLYEEQEKKAIAALAIAKRRLDDSLIYSPIDGYVSFRAKKEGEFCGAGAPIVRVADPRVLEVSAFLPSEYYPRVVTNVSKLHVTVGAIDLGEFTVYYKSPEIQDQLRTFEVKCLVESPPEGVAPGAMAQIETVLHSYTAIGVPQEIIQIRDNKSFVFVADAGKARAVEVQPGLSTSGWIDISQSELKAGDQVIVKGYNLVNHGVQIEMIGGE